MTRNVIFLCGDIATVVFVLRFLSMWVGGNTKLSNVNSEEVERAIKVVSTHKIRPHD